MIRLIKILLIALKFCRDLNFDAGFNVSHLRVGEESFGRWCLIVLRILFQLAHLVLQLLDSECFLLNASFLFWNCILLLHRVVIVILIIIVIEDSIDRAFPSFDLVDIYWGKNLVLRACRCLHDWL